MPSKYLMNKKKGCIGILQEKTLSGPSETSTLSVLLKQAYGNGLVGLTLTEREEDVALSILHSEDTFPSSLCLSSAWFADASTMAFHSEHGSPTFLQWTLKLCLEFLVEHRILIKCRVRSGGISTKLFL